jgi:hypothetical protein
MSTSTSAESQPKDDASKIAQYLESKRYIQEPELLPWYQVSISRFNPKARELLENYSNIAPADVEAHVKKVVSLCCRLCSSTLT